MAELLSGNEYQSYLNDPFKEGNFKKAVDLFSFSPITYHYHVHKQTDSYLEIKDKKSKIKDRNSNKVLIHPQFLPRIASNGIDVRKEFDKNSRFNPDSVNNTILTLPVYTYIMSAHEGRPLSEVMSSSTRINHVNYYLHFHYSYRDCNTTKKVHTSYGEKYRQSYNSKSIIICHKSTAMIGILDFVLTIRGGHW